jgi:hypothetical protein
MQTMGRRSRARRDLREARAETSVRTIPRAGVAARRGTRCPSFFSGVEGGDRMDIEIDFVFGAAIRAIASSDTVRQDLHEQLAALGYERSLVVTFTADRRWAA